MKKLRNIVVFFVLPVVALYLLYLNGSIAAKKYAVKDSKELKQYDAVITSDEGKAVLAPGEKAKINIKLKNAGTMTWIPEEKNSINLSYHLFDTKDNIIEQDGERTKLPRTLKSGEETSIEMLVKVPKEEGQYKIEVDLVHEGVTWFKQKGSSTHIINLEVKK